MEPPGFYDTLPMLKGFRPVDRIAVYSILGSVPLYLAGFSDRDDIHSNIRRLMMEPGSFLYEEGHRILLEDLREPRNYIGILSAVAAGRRRVREIVASTGLEKGMVSKYLDVLRAKGLVVRELPLLDDEGESRRGLYFIRSNYLRFYLRFIQPHRDQIELGKQEQLLARVVKPGLDKLVGDELRFIFREFLQRLNRDDKLGWRFSRFGSWWDRESFMDVLATDGRGERYLFGACSWQKDEQGDEMNERLRAMVKPMGLKKTSRVLIALFNRGGFRTDAKWSLKDQSAHLFELKDLVKEGA